MQGLQLSPLLNKFNEVDSLPKPEGVPVLGNLLSLKLPKLHQVLESWADKYGELYHFRVFHQRHVVISNPALIKEILRARPETFLRIEKLRQEQDVILANGVFSSEGTDWKRQRKLLIPGLSNATLGKTIEHIYTSTDRLLGLWEGMQGEDVDILQDIMRHTVDVTSLMVFGHDMNTIEKGDNLLQQHIAEIFSQMSFRINFPFPYWRYVTLRKERRYNASKKFIEQHVYQLIEVARNKMASYVTGNEQAHNLIEAMLIASDPESPGAKLSDDEVFANALTMLLAGEDTTANSLAWLVYYLAKSPSQQNKIRAEAHDVIGDSGMISDTKQMRLLPYTMACIQETMRLRSTAPVFFMENAEPVALNGVYLPTGTPIYLLSRHAGLQSQYCENPGEFLPERWLAGAEKQADSCPHASAHAPDSHIPFGYGPRICIGMNLAMLEMVVAAVMLCQRFEIEPGKSPVPVSEVFGLTMKPEHLRVRLRAR